MSARRSGAFPVCDGVLVMDAKGRRVGDYPSSAAAGNTNNTL